MERALALFQPGRDDDLAFRFGPDPGVVAMHYLALTLWPIGDIGRAVSLVGRAEARIADLTHVGTLAPGRMHAAMFDLMRGDRARVAPNAFELTRLAREFDLNLFRAFGVFLEGWASAASGASGSGLEGMRRGVELLREQNVLWFDGLLKMALAEAEAQAGDPGRAVAILDEALATCDRTGYRAFEAELHRARGEMLLKRDPANPAPAEEAFLTAIAVAKQQATRSFELRAALSLAKLYQSTGRPADAHAVLAPALEGFCADAGNAGDRRGAGAAIATAVGLRRAMKLISCSPCKDSFRLDSGPSRGNHCTRAIRPTVAATDAVCYVRSTSTPAVRFAHIADVSRRRLSERVKSKTELPTGAALTPSGNHEPRIPSARLQKDVLLRKKSR